MNLNSPLFDKIRAHRQTAEPEVRVEGPGCAHPGCRRPGPHRAPLGRDHEGQYLSFCLDHVREYNATYNYFKGMTDADVARYQREALVGHRPTWSMGVNRNGQPFREDGVDPASTFRDFATGRRHADRTERARPRHGVAVMKALTALGLDENATAETVKLRYKEMVKRLHPDANGGDRSREDKLREIIQAYNYLKTVKLP